jgi:RNA polymerase sigma factor (sigma-70 family)
MGKKDLPLGELIEGCVRKEFRCEERLYKSFYGYVSGVAFRYVKERTVIKELVNDAFVRIFRKIADFSFNGPPEEQEKAFKGWVGKITANIAIDRIRSKKTWLYIEDIAEEHLQEIAIESPDHLSFQEVMALLENLPQIQHLIFNLHEIEGFSHEEIAVKLQIPSGTSRVYLTRAKARLMELYQKLMKISYES